MRRRNQYQPVDASPVKSFFVQMLTRDIKLEEAILDLLDNCVDGVLRTVRRTSSTKPFAGFSAEIEFAKDSFAIYDNCGGIPWGLHDYAFRMGRAADRPADPAGAVGVYGIGMKRAIFKIGKRCLISTRNGPDAYEVEIDPSWIADEGNWRIPVRAAKKPQKKDGTEIVIGDLNPGVAERFSDAAEAFTAELERMVATHYAFIIAKGFAVKINRRTVQPKPTKLVFSKPTTRRTPAVRPFVYKARIDNIDVFLAVGFTRPIPDPGEVADDQVETRYSSIEAGWTVLCNDRAVLYADRTELTGWGEAGVPRYHTQFIAISGIVEFTARTGAAAARLPTTTTKRGIDASSRLYLQVKNKMREGMRIFIDYTNKWKGMAAEAKRHVEKEPTLDLAGIKRESRRLRFTHTKRSIPPGAQYKPTLPLPKRLEAGRRLISFTKKVEDVRAVALHLLEEENADPSRVGSECFDLVLRESRR